MSNRICRYAGFKPLDRDIINVLVPTGQTYQAGQVIVVHNLVSKTDIGGNLHVFEAVAAATAKLGEMHALIINGGDFETLADGRRPEGQYDWSQLSYKAGEIAPAIILSEGNEFELSYDAISGSAAVGQYLEPVDGGALLAVKASRTSGVKCAIKMLALNQFRSGGNFGGQFINTVVGKVLE